MKNPKRNQLLDSSSADQNLLPVNRQRTFSRRDYILSSARSRLDFFFKGHRICLLTVLLMTPHVRLHAADQAFRAYEATPIFGDNREVIKVGRRFVYCFPYRNGIITYRPKTGASWAKSPNGESVANVGVGPDANSSVAASRLPNSCLIFACAKAEEIRFGLFPRKSKSQVISFRRTDGSGHAFLIFHQNGLAYAEDDRGYVVPVSLWQDRSPAEALRIAKDFSAQTHPVGFPSPCKASFVGEY